ARIAERTLSLTGAERFRRILVYVVTHPANAKSQTYITNSDFTVDFDEDNYDSTKLAGDLGPEGLAFIDKQDSPNGKYLLLVGNEVSGTTTIYEVESVEIGRAHV